MRPQVAEIGSHSPHYGLKVAIPAGASWLPDGDGQRPLGRNALSAVGRSFLVTLGLFVLLAASTRAEDLERGKSGPAIFAADCSGCHRSAQGLAYGMGSGVLMDFLRQHYTTGPGPANQVAAYLLSVVGNGRRPKEKALTEPRSTAAAPAGEPAGKRRPGEEPADSATAGPRPPAGIGGSEAATDEPGTAGRGGPASKRRQQADRPAEPALQSRSKRLDQPATGTHGLESEPDRPPQSIPAPPSESAVARPAEPSGASQPKPSAEAKPTDAAPRAESARPEASADTGQARPAARGEARPTSRQGSGDQSAFSAPSP